MRRTALGVAALAAALSAPALADAVAIAQPTPAPIAQPIALENQLLALQLIDDLTTRYYLSRNGAPAPCPAGSGMVHCTWKGGTESDPLARPFVRSNTLILLTTAAINGAIRLVPPSRTKNVALRVIVGAEALNDARNIWISLAVSK